MRLEWQRLLRDRPALLERAYALDTSAQITVFIAGGLLAALGLLVLGGRGTLGACAVLTLLGGAAFARWSRAEGSGKRRATGASPIRVPGVRTLVAAVVVALRRATLAGQGWAPAGRQRRLGEGLVLPAARRSERERDAGLRGRSPCHERVGCRM